MLKCELEQKLGKTLTNQEYSQYVRQEYLQKKYGNKKQVQNTTNFTFIDAKEEYLNTLEEKDKNYYKQNYEYVLKIANYFILFEKPRIKTSFCFGHGQNGVSTEEETNNAFSMLKHARTSEKYFIEENLEELNQKIEEIEIFLMDDWEQKEKYVKEQYQLTKKWHYMNAQHIEKMFLCANNGNTAYIFIQSNYRDEERLHFCEVIKELTKDDLKNILAVYQQQKKNFEKRLQTYLKRYGLSKLHTWTYLVD